VESGDSNKKSHDLSLNSFQHITAAEWCLDKTRKFQRS